MSLFMYMCNTYVCVCVFDFKYDIWSLPIFWQDTDGVLFEPLPDSAVDAIPQREATEVANKLAVAASSAVNKKFPSYITYI